MKDSFIVEPSYMADACVIWLHGLGANGHDFKALLPQLELNENHTIRFIFPNAPVQPVKINAGMEMPAWYDIRRIDDIKREVDHKGILLSIQRINDIVEAQINAGINSENVILAGFPQGGVIAGLSAICSRYKLGGVLLLSTYLPDWAYFQQHMTESNIKTQFIVAHGVDDSVVPLAAGELLKQTLIDEGFCVKDYHYPMGHTLCAEEIQMIASFIKEKLCLQWIKSP